MMALLTMMRQQQQQGRALPLVVLVSLLIARTKVLAWISEQYPVHTLLLCRHGDSIWNGGCPGEVERFTGWTDVPLSRTGRQEAEAAATQLNSYLHDIDVCFTSILSRAQETTEICLTGMAAQQQKQQLQMPGQGSSTTTTPPVHIDYRLNERHYGGLQEYCKSEVEEGKFPQWQDKDLIQQWRRSWFVRPPQMDENDPRRLRDLEKYSIYYNNVNHNSHHQHHHHHGVPNGESLEMVAKNRVRPFVNEILTPVLDAQAKEKRQKYGKIDGEWPQTTGLIIAHANSLRALLGVVCEVEDDPEALQVLESLRLPTGVPLVIHYSATRNGKYKAWPVPYADECVIHFGGDDDGQLMHPPAPPENMGHKKLPVWPLNMCIPLMYHAVEHAEMGMGMGMGNNVFQPQRHKAKAKVKKRKRVRRRRR